MGDITITENQITNLVFIFRLKKGSKYKYTSIPVTYYKLEFASKGGIITGIGSSGIIGISTGKFAYAGQIVTNAINAIPLYNLYKLAQKLNYNIKSFNINKLPLFDLLIINKKNKRSFQNTLVKNIKFMNLKDDSSMNNPARYHAYEIIATDQTYINLKAGGFGG